MCSRFIVSPTVQNKTAIKKRRNQIKQLFVATYWVYILYRFGYVQAVHYSFVVKQWQYLGVVQ